MINIFLLLLFSFYSYSVELTVTQKQDLNFGTLVQGDPKKVISAKGSEPNNARFLVKGDLNTAYTILLPLQIYISLDGEGKKQIKVHKFVSKPLEGANGLLNAKGKQTVKVGATLAKIGVNKQAGSYFGSFTIDVIY